MRAVRVYVDGELADVTYERDDDTHVMIVMAGEAAEWLIAADLLDSFGVVVVAPSPRDRHDPTYAERAEAFLSMHHAPAAVLEALEDP